MLGCTILFFQIPLNMKSTELRIGNWVFNNKQIQVNSQHIKLFDEGLYHLLPIPLTEDWLLKFGFKSVSLGEYQLGSILLDNEYTHKGVFNILDGDHCLSVEILYVNQLQNLYFALMQQELLLTT